MIIPTAADPLRPCGTDPAAFDALICSSGAELCYPWMELSADEEYRVLRARVAPVARGAREVVRAAVPRLGKAKVRVVSCWTSRFISFSMATADGQFTADSAGEEGRFDRPGSHCGSADPVQARVHARVHSPQRDPAGAIGIAAARAQVTPDISHQAETRVASTLPTCHGHF